MVEVLVVFHTITGNVMELAKAVARGAEEAGATTRLKRVEETIQEEILEKNPGYVKIRNELKSIPVASVEELPDYDAIVFGSPTRFGNMSSQMKTFIDRTGKHWVNSALAGNVGAVFTSNEMPHGGKEATLLSMLLPLLAHGMIIVGLPPVRLLYKAGSYYGATSTGKPSQEDLEVAKLLGKRVAEVAAKLKAQEM